MLFHKPDSADLAALSAWATVLPGASASEDYAHDEMTEYGAFAPDALALCESAGGVAKVLGYCAQKNIAVTPRGAGTGLCGGAVPIHGGVVLSLERMNHILEIDENTMTATVEPGVLLSDFIREVEARGLFYPPDPGEKTATLGGNAMTNAGGMRAVRYGVTRDYVLGMQVALPSGELLDLGGKVVKTSSGYSLLSLLVGSEGTLGIVTKLILKLLPMPRANVSVLAPFDDLDACVRAVPQVLACGAEPTAVEFMEREVIACAETYLGKRFPDTSADAYLLVRLDGPSAKALEASCDQLAQTLLDLGARDALLADTDERKSSIWDARGAFLEAIKSGTPSMDECDVVVPRDKIADFVRASREISRDCGVRILSFGHAGDGNLHIYALMDDLPPETWANARQAVMDALYRQAALLGGQVSGEHGIGHAKAGYLRESAGNTAIELMRGIKAVFDPRGILNPGKVIG